MKALKFEESILLDASPEVVFDYTQDYQQRLKWDTFLKRAELIDGAASAEKGVKAYCVARNGLGMVTEYVSFRRPSVTAIQMTEGPFLFKTFQGSWRFKPVEAAGASAPQTRVTFLYSFSLRFPFSLASGWILKILQRNVRQRLVNLKQIFASNLH